MTINWSYFVSPMFWMIVIMGALTYLMLNEKPRAWLARTLGSTGERLKRRYVVLMITTASLLSAGALTFYLIEVGISVAALVDRLEAAALDSTSKAEDLRGLAYAVAALLGVMAAAATIFFSIIRVWINERNTTAVEQGQITDRINKAVEGLGAEKTIKEVHETPRYQKDDEGNWLRDDDGNPIPAERADGTEIVERDTVERSVPNLEVRIGAIYALERIAKDSDRDHVQIMEILCAYIRQNAPASGAAPWPELEMKPEEEDGPLDEDWEERLAAFRIAQKTAKTSVKLRDDIQTALTVIGRRSAHQRALEARANGGDGAFVFDIPSPKPDLPDDEHDPDALKSYRKSLNRWKSALSQYAAQGGFRLDLRDADLSGADMSRLNFAGARFDGSVLQGADLTRARLQGADLTRARLQGADLTLARLQGADLKLARLQGANLWEARLQGADPMRARLQGAHLELARLQGAHLGGARLQGAHLWEARLQGAHLELAQLQGAHLWEARLQGAHLGGARFDPATTLTAATLRGAAVRKVDCTNLLQLVNHADEMFGDGSVTLPDDIRPDHWAKKKLGDQDFTAAWRAWQATLADEPDDR